MEFGIYELQINGEEIDLHTNQRKKGCCEPSQIELNALKCTQEKE